MAYHAATGEVVHYLAHQQTEMFPLFRRPRIGGDAFAVQTAFVADAYTALVEAAGVRTDAFEGTGGIYHTVLADVYSFSYFRHIENGGTVIRG